MARVSANLLYIVIYGTQLACHLDPADGQLDPAEGENGGYTTICNSRAAVNGRCSRNDLHFICYLFNDV